MSNINKSLRIRTNVGEDKYISVNLEHEYDTLEILSLKINQKGAYRYHTSTYGVIVGRVMANNGFGVPNAKLSLFIAKDEKADVIENAIYPYTTVGSKDSNGVRYNLLPSNQKDNCHQVVGTFPSKRMVLDDNSVLEVFDKYYLYTTRTNESGDYMFFGVPTGSYNLHMDLDISDCGKLSQRPRDFIYKGYSLEQFENPNQFKIDEELMSLPQIFSQDITIEVKPFWGDTQEGTDIGITREDININYKFEPTCVFMGSIVSDTPNDGINKRCVPTNRMGDMRELTTGSGTIEIIRKTIGNTVEELQIKGKQLINGNGVWCFQIPMNLDYVTTDEYGNTVPTDNPDKGIPTRCEVRFRMSMDESDSESLTFKRGKVLVPHNPHTTEEFDYEFGSKTKEESFRSLMWNGVYSIKSFIPRFQKSMNVKTNKFTGIKNVNIHGGNNPIPYNNIRIKISFMFWLLCNVAKLFVRIIELINKLKRALMSASLNLVNLPYAYIGNELCPDLEYWYFAPGMNLERPSYTWVRRFWDWLTGNKGTNQSVLCRKWQHESVCLTFKAIAEDLKSSEPQEKNENIVYFEYIGKNVSTVTSPTMLTVEEFETTITGDKGAYLDLTTCSESEFEAHANKVDENYYSQKNWVRKEELINELPARDGQSTELKNAVVSATARIKLTPDINYLMECVEMNLAQEYEVIKFDFYNDWLNGVIYLPRWMRQVKFRKKRRNGKRIVIEKVKGCLNDTKRSRITRRYMQQCSLSYDSNMKISTNIGCTSNGKLKCHKKVGSDTIEVLGKNGGVVREQETMLGDNVYYMIPCEFRGGKRIPMFATDIIMLGNLFDCNEYGIPSTFESLITTTYKLPSNLAMTNADDDSYSYMDKYTYSDEDGQPPTVDEVDSWTCGDVCALDYMAMDGVTAIIPSYDDVKNILSETEGIDGEVLEYEDFFPITEMSGIEWGYTGPGQGKNSGNKMYSPGGHFMGLACGNAETNIKSCVNLKRACEIGTTFSERIEIPIGYKKDVDETAFDVANYLYVSPNGLISKDQVVDVTFRSAFATMNQNSLKTIVDPVTKHKKYDFKYLIPDSFDGSLSNKAKEGYNAKIPLEWDSYWDTFKDNDDYKEIFDKEVVIEQGYTINRLFETRSDDYISFRHGDKVNYLTDNSMPVYENSFYFYFGLKSGFTALDEFKTQFFAPCSISKLIGDYANITFEVERATQGFSYTLKVNTQNLTAPYDYILKGDGYADIIKNDITEKSFFIKLDNGSDELEIGNYTLIVTDANGVEIVKNISIGINDFTLDYNSGLIENYKRTEERTTLSEFIFENNDKTNGGSISGTFTLHDLKPFEDKESQYEIIIKHGNYEVKVGDNNWNQLYDEETETLWLFGVGMYEVYVKEKTTGDSFLYGSFNVLDGVKPPAIYLGDIRYCSELNKTTLNEVKTLPYHKYRLLVNPSKVLDEPFSLAFNHGNENSDFIKVVAGKAEKIRNGVSEINNEVTLLNDVPSKFSLDINNIYLPSDYNNDERGEFYYTAYNKYNNIFASDYKVVKSNNGVVTTTLNSNGSYYVMIDDGKLSLHKYDGDEITVNVNTRHGGDVIFGKMEPLHVFNNPFAFKAIALISQHASKFITEDGFGNDDDGLQTYNVDGNVYPIYNDDGVGNIIVTDYEAIETDTDAPLYRNFEQFSFNHLTNLMYSHTNEDTNVIFRLNDLNEDIENSSYYLVNGEHDVINHLQDTLKIRNIKAQYDKVGADVNMEIESENGAFNAYTSISKEGLTTNNYWAYGIRLYSGGTVGTPYYNNDYYELKEVKINRNTLKFTTYIVKDLSLTHTYSGENYKLYKWENNSIVETNEYDIFSNLELGNSENSELIFRIEPNGSNIFRYGYVYEHKQKPSSQSNIFATNIHYDSFEMIYAEKEDANNDEYYSAKFHYGNNFAMSANLKEGIIDAEKDNESYFYKVIVALNGDGGVIRHTLLTEGAELKLSIKEIKELDKFEIRYVYNYEGWGKTGSGSGNSGGVAQKLAIAIIVTPMLEGTTCKKLVFNTGGIIDSNKKPVVSICYSVDGIGACYASPTLDAGAIEVEVTISDFDKNGLDIHLVNDDVYEGTIVINDPQ